MILKRGAPAPRYIYDMSAQNRALQNRAVPNKVLCDYVLRENETEKFTDPEDKIANIDNVDDVVSADAGVSPQSTSKEHRNNEKKSQL